MRLLPQLILTTRLLGRRALPPGGVRALSASRRSSILTVRALAAWRRLLILTALLLVALRARPLVERPRPPSVLMALAREGSFALSWALSPVSVLISIIVLVRV